jgi:hypothetical protein
VTCQCFSDGDSSIPPSGGRNAPDSIIAIASLPLPGVFLVVLLPAYLVSVPSTGIASSRQYIAVRPSSVRLPPAAFICPVRR